MNGREFDQFVTPLERLSALEPVILTCVDWARQDATAFTYWPEGRGAFVAYDDGHSVAPDDFRDELLDLLEDIRDGQSLRISTTPAGSTVIEHGRWETESEMVNGVDADTADHARPRLRKMPHAAMTGQDGALSAPEVTG